MIAIALQMMLAASPDAALQAELTRQAGAWNRGDLDAFCAFYADDAVFISPSGVTRGRQAVLDRYKKRYPTPAAMGTLSLEAIDTRLFGQEGATAMARWTLSYPDKPPATGLTLVVLRREGRGWRILQDASM
jgi:uncharacterized protein (TIGR02246 family)